MPHRKVTLPADDVREMNRLLNKLINKTRSGIIKSTRKKTKRKTKRLMTIGQKKALIKAIGKNKSMKPASRKSAIRKIRAKKTRKA